MPKKKSAILEAVHETATGLHKAGLMDQWERENFWIYGAIEPLTGQHFHSSLPQA
ncbi:hypothetical protein [Nostoc sp.]|uniref:hypothetical protein n=1 Tax=Nostoc sp. TaxID=1180 RepID=UPI002FF9A280